MLSDGDSEFNRNRTDILSVKANSTDSDAITSTFGGDFRRQEFNEYTQQNPRGTFMFTGAATTGGVFRSRFTPAAPTWRIFCSAFPTPARSPIGNPDKYFRQSVYDLYITDEWRAQPELTINAGMRWDYGAPLYRIIWQACESRCRCRVLLQSRQCWRPPRVGPVTGMKYPNSLVRPDKHGFEPRIGISWRPIPASTLVVRAGYGIYDDTSVYLSAAETMAQQAPLSTSVSEANSSACPLTLANGFLNCAGAAADTFAIDPESIALAMRKPGSSPRSGICPGRWW